MKPFAELTEVGKIRRLHGLARKALRQYDFEVVRLRCIAHEINWTFRVDTSDRRTLALRVATDPQDTDVHTPTEVAWLRAIEEAPEIDAVRVIPTASGDDFVELEHPGVPGARACVIFSWVPGRTIGESAGPEDYLALGRLAARLHDHGESWRMPGDLQPLVWDRVFYYPTEPVVLYEDRFRHHLTRSRTEVVRAVEQAAATELERLHRELPTFIIHGDLHPWNVHRYRERLIVFDFEDLMIGAPVQDVAITLYYNRSRPQYDDLVAAFREGYTGLRPWPVERDGQLELLMGARTVSFINYVLRMGIDPDQYLPRWIGALKRLL